MSSEAYAKEQQLVETVAKILVDRPDEVVVSIVEEEKQNTIEIRAHESDYGKIIGRRGRIVNSIRMLLSVVSRDSKKRWIIHIPEKPGTGSENEYDQEGDSSEGT